MSQENTESPAVEAAQAPEPIKVFDPVGDWIAAKLASQNAETEPVDSTPEEPQEEETPQVEEKPEEATAEPESRLVKRMLEKERKLREEREAWLAEQKDTLSKVEQFEKAQEEAKYNLSAYLNALGLSNEEKLDAMRIVWFEEFPDLVDENVKERVTKIKDQFSQKQLADRLAKLEKPPEEPEKPAGPEVFEPYPDVQIPLAAKPIFENLKTYAETAESNPLTREYMAKGDAEARETVLTMYNIAYQYAQEQKFQGEALAPAECMKRIEDFLAAKQPSTPPITKDPEPPTVEAPTPSLRNSVGAAQPTNPNPPTGFSDEAKAARKRNAIQRLKEMGYGH